MIQYLKIILITKEEKSQIISIDAKRRKKEFDKIQNSSMIKTCKKIGMKGNFLKMIKISLKKLTTNIILNGEWLKSSLLRIVLDVLVNAIKQEKEIQGKSLRKKKK